MRKDTYPVPLPLPQVGHDPVYGSTVVYERELADARAAVRAEKAAESAHDAALEARNAAVRAYYAAARDEASQNELARRLDLNPSTFRSIITRAPRTR